MPIASKSVASDLRDHADERNARVQGPHTGVCQPSREIRTTSQVRKICSTKHLKRCDGLLQPKRLGVHIRMVQQTCHRVFHGIFHRVFLRTFHLIFHRVMNSSTKSSFECFIGCFIHPSIESSFKCSIESSVESSNRTCPLQPRLPLAFKHNLAHPAPPHKCRWDPNQPPALDAKNRPNGGRASPYGC